MRTRPKGQHDPGWQRISWPKAFQIISEKLLNIRKTHGAHAVVFNRPGPGGSPSRDYAHWVVRLAYAFGSPNTLATGHVCQWHRDTGSKYTYGWQKVPEPDYQHTKLVVVWGHNPFASVRCNARDILNAKKRGAKLVAVDPRRTPLADKADLWLQIRPGTDGALLLALINWLIQQKTFDENFVKHWTNAPFLIDSSCGDLLRSRQVLSLDESEGFLVWDTHSHQPCAYNITTGTYDYADVDPELFKEVQVKSLDGKEVNSRPVFAYLKDIAERFDLKTASAITHIPENQIHAFAEMITQNRPMCYYSYNGLEQHTQAMQTNRALCIFYTLTGNLDCPGGNVFFPAIASLKIRDPHMLPQEAHRLRLGHTKRPLGPAGYPNSSAQAYEVFETLLTDKPYPLKAMVAFGGNIITSNANSLVGKEALEKLDFFVQTELFMTPSAELADIVLPAATFFESPALKPGFPNLRAARKRIQFRPAVISPLNESKPDLEIIFDLAQHLGLSEHFWDGNIESAFNAQLQTCDLDLVELKRHPRGISVSLDLTYKKYEKHQPQTDGYHGFKTPSKRVEIFSQRFKDFGYEALPDFQEPGISPLSKPQLRRQYPLILTCSKLLHFCHGQHRGIPSLRKAVPHPFVEVNPTTAVNLGIENDEWVYVETPQGKIRCQAFLTESIAENVVCIQHGWWQSCPDLGLPGYDPYSAQGANANLLYTTDVIDKISGSVPYKAYLCNLKKIAEEETQSPIREASP
jgi:anaerobic selenocysteine-containing dehydrogenase